MIRYGVEADFEAIGLRRREDGYASDDFILSVSTLMAHKNFDTLLPAFAGFAKRNPSTRLVIAGIKGPETARLEAVRAALRLEDRVEFTGGFRNRSSWIFSRGREPSCTRRVSRASESPSWRR